MTQQRFTSTGRPLHGIEGGKSSFKPTSEQIRSRRKLFGRGVLATAVVTTGLFLATSDSDNNTLPTRTMNQPTLSQFADEQLKEQGVFDPSTLEINAAVAEIANANPGAISGHGAGKHAEPGSTLAIPDLND